MNNCHNSNKLLIILIGFVITFHDIHLCVIGTNTILKLFDEIELDLHKLNKPFYTNMEDSQPLRQRRHIFRNVEACKISKETLIYLNEEIQYILSNTTDSFNNVNNCVLNITTHNSNCTELIQMFHCAVNHLKTEYKNLSEKNKVPLEKFFKLQNSYNQLWKQFQKREDNLKKYYGQLYKTELDKLFNDLQKMQEQLQIANEKLFKHVIESCAANIFLGQIDKSIQIYKEFENIDDTNTLIEIINNVYSKYVSVDNSIEKLKHIVDFLVKIQNKCTQFAGHLIFLKLMQEENHITCISDDELWPYIKESLTWVQTENNIEHCANRDDYHNFCRSYINDNINLIHSKCIFSQMESVIDLISDLFTPKQQLYIYPVLFENIKKRNGYNGYEIVFLAFNIKEFIKQYEHELNVTNLLKLKTEFPNTIQKLISDEDFFYKKQATQKSCIR